MPVQNPNLLVRSDVPVTVDQHELFWLLTFAVRWALSCPTELSADTHELLYRYAERLTREQVDSLVGYIELKVEFPSTPRHKRMENGPIREEWRRLVAWLRGEGLAS